MATLATHWSHTHLDLVELLICAGLNLNTLPEPLLLHYVDSEWDGGDVGGVDIIGHHQVCETSLPHVPSNGPCRKVSMRGGHEAAILLT